MISNTNKKNFKLKNIIFMSPLSRTKLNIPNLITQTKRILTTTGNNRILNSTNVSNYVNKSNKILNEIYRSYSTNRHIQPINSNNKNNNKKKNNSKNSVGNSPKLSSFSKFTSSLNKIKNMKGNSYSTGFPITNFFGKNNSEEKKLRKRNLNEIIISCNSSYSSNLFNKKYSNSSNKQNKFKPKLKNDLHKRNKTSFSTQNNSLSSDNFSIIIPSTINNIKMYYNGLYKKIINQKKTMRNKQNKNINKKIINKFEKTIQSQTNIISTSQSTLTKKKTKSLNTNLSNENEYVIIKNIDTPEELHFLYINILQNGKDIEGKFEESSSINN
jgi:hypothetical protein